jgi:CubicO group peptidase (beta-lactamase class C family)
MEFLPWCLFVFLLQAAQVLANPNCPIYGAEFPKPTRLEDSPAWQAAMQNLSSSIDYLAQSAANYSFSVQVFSNNPGSPILYEKFHTAPNLPSNTTGVKTVDANTVYRIGSVTKIFTVLAFLAEAGDKYFNHPITEFIPELSSLSASRQQPADSDIRTVDWEDINLISLITQMSGIERDCEFSHSRRVQLGSSLWSLSYYGRREHKS